MMKRDEYISPDWGRKTPIHDWKNYASKTLIASWDNFTDEQKKVIAETLEEIAEREDWD